MARYTRNQWTSWRRFDSHGRAAQRSSGPRPLQRRLRIEPLEDRRLLSITVNSLVDEMDGSLVDGDISLRDAIAAAAQGETINFGVTGTINLTNLGHLTINKTLTINGPGASLLTINAFDPTPATNNGDGSRLFNIDDGNAATDTMVTLSGLTLTGGDVSGDGGAIRNAESLTVTGSTISGNVAHGTSVVSGYYGNYYYDHVGGGIWSSGSLTVTGSTVVGNTVTGSGGGIYSTGNLTVTNSAVSGNTTPRDGGGIYRGGGGAMVVTNSTINGNSADGYGGGIHGSNLTVTGSTISGNSSKRAGGGVAGGNLTIAGGTIKGNSAVLGGGGIFGSGDLAVTATTISGNSAGGHGGGIYNYYGNTTVVSSTISGNSATGSGGGISSSGILSVTASTIGDNTAGGSGGGVHATGTSLVLDSCTLIANSAGGEGGGVWTTSANLTIVNCTISANAAVGHGGGIYVDPRSAVQVTASIAHSTVVNNRADASNTSNRFGGGVFVRSGALILDHSIVAENYLTTMFGTRSDLAGLLGVILDARWSLIGHNADSGLAEAAVGSPDAKGNRIGGVVGGAIDPLLGPLVASGGATRTYELLAGSPALDAGRPVAVAGIGGVPLHDQRGNPFARVFDGDGSGGARIDIGAYERQSVVGLSLVVDTLKDESDGDYSLGDLSLRDATELARGSVLTADSITFAASLTSGGPATITLTLGELVIPDDLSIFGPGPGVLTVDARGNDPTPDMKNGDGTRVFNIDDNDNDTLLNITISGLTLTGGDVGDSDGGGAIRSLENLAVTSSTISGNSAGDGGGGGIFSSYINYASVTLTNSTISGNSAGGEGGGISASNLTVNDSTISGNSAGSGGGGIFADNLAATNSRISSNSASDGGGISGSNLIVTRSTISDNSARYSGGGIHGSDLAVTSSTISGNSAGDSGGGIYNYYGNLEVTSSTISGNSAHWGGGIYNYYGHLDVISSTISGNSAESAGGGLYNYYGLTTIEFSTITANTAPPGKGSGVAAYGDSSTRTAVRSSIIAGNVNSDVNFLFNGPNSFRSNGSNLIGTGNALGRFNQTGDQTGVANPLLGPLTDNGGPTWTHAPLVGSLAIDRGSSTAVAGSGGVPMFDQRGAPYTRVFNGDGAGGARIDIGALEMQPVAAPALPGDYNLSGAVDAADYVAWRNAMGSNTTAYSGADGDGNGIVDQADYSVWRAHFGKALALPDAGSGATELSALAGQEPLPTIVVSRRPSDAVFTTLGQRIPVKPMADRTALGSAAIDAAVSDSLLLVRLGRVVPKPADDAVRTADLPSKNNAAERELTLDLTENRLAVVRWSTDPAQFVV